MSNVHYTYIYFYYQQMQKEYRIDKCLFDVDCTSNNRFRALRCQYPHLLLHYCPTLLWQIPDSHNLVVYTCLCTSVHFTHTHTHTHTLLCNALPWAVACQQIKHSLWGWLAFHPIYHQLVFSILSLHLPSKSDRTWYSWILFKAPVP